MPADYARKFYARLEAIEDVIFQGVPEEEPTRRLRLCWVFRDADGNTFRVTNTPEEYQVWLSMNRASCFVSVQGRFFILTEERDKITSAVPAITG